MGAACSLVVYQQNPQDPWSPPTGWGCDCIDSGTGRVTWSNETTGASGYGDYQVTAGNPTSNLCLTPYSSWSAFYVPLAPGPNVISVTMQDGQTIGSGEVTITRN